MDLAALVTVVLLGVISPRTVLSQGGSRSSPGAGVQVRFGTHGKAPVGRFPYMCSLRSNADGNKHICGGFLVDPLWVLTAAHCVDPAFFQSTGLVPIVYCGIHDIDDDSEDLVFGTVNGIMHEDWDGKAENGNDIALLKLSRKSTAALPRLNVPNNRPPQARPLSGLGWGETSNGEPETKLQLAENLKAISPETCNARWDGTLNEEKVLCAGIGENDACDGDSGGPLLYVHSKGGAVKNGNPTLDLIVGIVSFGNNSCGKSERPGVYTDVGYYNEWIFRIIEGQSSPLSGGTRSPQPDPCANSPRLEDVIAAIKNDDLASVRIALDCGLDPGTRYNDTTVTDADSTDGTLLHWAARYDSSDSANVLVAYSADTEAKEISGGTPLHYCAFFGGPSVAKVLLDAGANGNARGPSRYTPLHYAARYNRIKTAEILLEYDAVLDPTNAFGETPLHLAAGTGNIAVIKILINAGAVLNAVDNDGETPLHEAAEYGKADAVKALLDAGASKIIENADGNKAEDIICSNSQAQCSRSTRASIERLLGA